MRWTKRNIRASLVAAALAGFFFSLPQTSLATGRTQSSDAALTTQTEELLAANGFYASLYKSQFEMAPADSL